MSEWIKCSDRMPPFDKDVLVYTDEGEIGLGRLFEMQRLWTVTDDHRLWCVYVDDFKELDEITHWQELPQPPEVTL